MDLSNLNSLKVADLKQLLKARGLSIVGVKSELIQRLESAMLSNPSGDSGAVVATKGIEKELDEDAILADDDESFSKPDESLLHNEDLLLSESISHGIVTPSMINMNASSSATTVAASKPDTNPTTSNDPNTSETITSKAPMKTTNTASSLKQLATTKNILTADEKKQVRLIKYADPKIKNRAERFGVTSPVVSTEADKIKQRMNRFGEAVSTKAKTIDENERVEKRRERFGVVSTPTTTTTTNKSNGFKQVSNPVVTEKITKRQERFGVVNDTANKQDGNKILPGFKRRRFAY